MGTERTSRGYTAKGLAQLLDISIARVGQLAKKGIIKKQSTGKYLPDSITRYIKWMRESSRKKVHEWSVLLEQERYREKKRQNDVEEGLVAPVAVLEDVLGRGVSAMIPILDGLPLVMKRHWPEITGDQIRLVKEAIAECRNALADVEITLDDD